MIFLDRMDAGRKLSDKLEKFNKEKVLVLAIPRGGVEVAFDTIKRFNYEWDLIIPRKIGSPQNKEVAVGAVSIDGSFFLNDYFIEKLNISKDYIDEETNVQIEEIRRRLREYRGTDALPDVYGKTVILIDDGIATGYTILAAIKSIKKLGAHKIILAIPVGPRETLEEFKELVDEVICLYIPDEFYAVGLYYSNFKQVTDEEVFKIMNELRG